MRLQSARCLPGRTRTTVAVATVVLVVLGGLGAGLASTGGEIPWVPIVIGGLFLIAGGLVNVIRRAVR